MLRLFYSAHLHNPSPELRELFLDIVMTAAELKAAFLLPVLELVGPQREASKTAGLISETTNITAEMLTEQPFFRAELPQITCYLNIILVVHNL